MHIGYVVAEHDQSDGHHPDDKHPVLPQLQLPHNAPRHGQLEPLLRRPGRQRPERPPAPHRDHAEPGQEAHGSPPPQVRHQRLGYGGQHQRPTATASCHQSRCQGNVLLEVVIGDAHGWCVGQTAAKAVEDGEGAEEGLQVWGEGGDEKGEGADGTAQHGHGAVAEASDEGAGGDTKQHGQPICQGPNPGCNMADDS